MADLIFCGDNKIEAPNAVYFVTRFPAALFQKQ